MEKSLSAQGTHAGKTITHEIPLVLPVLSMPVSHQLLEQFTASSLAAEGVDIRQLASAVELHVQTLNTYYKVVMLDPAQSRVLIQGGALFPMPTEVILRGATQGGAVLKTGWINVGFQVELSHYLQPGQLQNVVTSPVEQLWFNLPSVNA